jgi:hypothetical protein
MLFIALSFAFVFFVLSVVFPTNVAGAIEIIKQLFEGGGAIVGTG